MRAARAVGWGKEGGLITRATGGGTPPLRKGGAAVGAPGELTPKQQRFCEEFVKDHNATQAALRAGYAKCTAMKKAGAWVSKVGIREEIERLEKWATAKCRVDAQWVIDQIADIAENGKADRDRLKALEMLAKHFGLLEKKEQADTEIHVHLGEAAEWLA